RKLIAGSPYFKHVAASLREGWSPLQIAGRLGRMEDGDHPGRIIHESIYTALYALPRGELRRELLAALRQGRQNSRSLGTDRRKGFVSDDIRIAERPEDVEGRLVPGHWDGDLIKGAANRSAVGMLVERTSRLVLLARMYGHDAATTRCAFEGRVRERARTLPQVPHLRSRHRNGPPCRARRTDGDQGMVLRSLQPLAARIERECQRSDPAIPAQRHRPRPLLTGPAQRYRRTP
ncbi:MAG: IS30 family transposase, partial [Rhodocyclaceae bacterium]|nr:IS30 family transposase [Rhodocyclaceae bacterium]